MRPYIFAPLASAAVLTLAACSTAETPTPTTSEPQAPDHAEHSGHSEHSEHNHAMDGGPVPAGMVEVENPTYPAGTRVTLNADHMPGMQGAPATIVGAYDTTTYEVSYTPTDGSAPVNNHKWVVQEEIADAGTAPLADGSEVTLTADHMPGMQGATATVDSSTDGTVYVVDVDADGMKMTSHKWVVENEISPAQ